MADEDFDESPFINELRDNFIEEFEHLENALNSSEQLPEVVGFFIAGVQIAYQSFLRSFVSERHRDSICTFRHCRAGVSEPEPEMSFSPASEGIRLSRDMEPWEREEQRRFFKNLRNSSDPVKRKRWLEVIDTYKDYFIADYQRSRRMTADVGEPGCSEWPTFAELTEGPPGGSRDQPSAQQPGADFPGGPGGILYAMHSVSQLGTSRGPSSAEEPSSGLSGGTIRLFSDQQPSTSQPGSSRVQSSAQQSSRGQSAAERQTSASWFGSHQEHYPSAAASSSRLGEQAPRSTFRTLGEDELVGSLEHAVRTTRSTSGLGAEAREYGREITSERWRGHVQKVAASDESPALRPDSRSSPDVSLSSDLIIRPNDILTAEERERMLGPGHFRKRGRAPGKKERETKDNCSRWLRSHGIDPSCWGEPGSSSSSSDPITRTAEPSESKRSKKIDPKDQPGPSGVRRSVRLTAKKQKTPSKGSPEDDSDSSE